MHSSWGGVFGLSAVRRLSSCRRMQVFAQLRGGALGGRARIVQLVHQAGGEGAERDELFAVQRFNLVGLETLAISASTFLRTPGQQAINFQKSCSRSGGTPNPEPRR